MTPAELREPVEARLRRRLESIEYEHPLQAYETARAAVAAELDAIRREHMLVNSPRVRVTVEGADIVVVINESQDGYQCQHHRMVCGPNGGHCPDCSYAFDA